MLGRVEKNVKNICFCFKKIEFPKNLVFRSVALVTKKLWGILDFFSTDRTFYRPVCTQPYALKKITKNPF